MSLLKKIIKIGLICMIKYSKEVCGQTLNWYALWVQVQGDGGVVLYDGVFAQGDMDVYYFRFDKPVIPNLIWNLVVSKLWLEPKLVCPLGTSLG